MCSDHVSIVTHSPQAFVGPDLLQRPPLHFRRHSWLHSQSYDRLQVFAEGIEEEGLAAGELDEAGPGGAVSPEMLLSFDEFRSIMEEHDVRGGGAGG